MFGFSDIVNFLGCSHGFALERSLGYSPDKSSKTSISNLDGMVASETVFYLTLACVNTIG